MYILEVGGCGQPGNRFRFRVRVVRDVRAGEAKLRGRARGDSDSGARGILGHLSGSAVAHHAGARRLSGVKNAKNTSILT